MNKLQRSPSGWTCPHCQSVMFIRTSKTMHPVLRTYYLRCENFECGATYTADMEITQQLSPSGIPDFAMAKQLEEMKRRRDEKRTPERTCKASGRFQGVDHFPSGNRMITPQDLQQRTGKNIAEIMAAINEGELPEPTTLSDNTIAWPAKRLVDFFNSHQTSSVDHSSQVISLSGLPTKRGNRS